MICPKCKKQKEKGDFYYRKNNPNEKTKTNCKVCVSEECKARTRHKNLAKSDPLYAYFN